VGDAEPPEGPTATAETDAEATSEEKLVEEDVLVEEISIDGMCGVY
jgi:mycofactocin precursor